MGLRKRTETAEDFRVVAVVVSEVEEVDVDVAVVDVVAAVDVVAEITKETFLPTTMSPLPKSRNPLMRFSRGVTKETFLPTMTPFARSPNPMKDNLEMVLMLLSFISRLLVSNAFVFA